MDKVPLLSRVLYIWAVYVICSGISFLFTGFTHIFIKLTKDKIKMLQWQTTPINDAIPGFYTSSCTKNEEVICMRNKTYSNIEYTNICIYKKNIMNYYLASYRVHDNQKWVKVLTVNGTLMILSFFHLVLRTTCHILFLF